MARLITDGIVKKARIWHHCDCCDSIVQSGCTFSDYNLTFSEKKTLVKAIKINDGKIQKGEPYYWQFVEQDGEIYTFKCIESVYNILKRIGLFNDNN